MTTKTIPVTAVSVQSTKPTTRFGQLAILPLSNTAAYMVRASLTGIPADATVTSATLVLRSRNSPTWSGTRTISVRTLVGPFSTSSTWNVRPGGTGTDATLAIANAPFGAYWNVDITAKVQAWVSGTVANNGVIVFTSETTAGQFQGVTAEWGAPTLVVNYTTSAQAPTGLNPSSGAVSLASPTLTFQTAADTQSIQVQVDQVATNLVASNYGFETNTTGWTTSGTLTRSTVEHHSGVGAGQLVAASAAQYAASPTAAAIASAVYSGSIWLKGTAAATATVYIATSPGGSVAVSKLVTFTGAWQRVTLSGFAAANATSVYLQVSMTAAGTVYIDDAVLTQTSVSHDVDTSGVVQVGFDSGEVAATAGLLDLSTTSFTGLLDGGSSTWRARVKNAQGWSAWSSWVAFSRAAWKTLTITAPTATSEDPSPPVTATYGGTVTAWRVVTWGPTGAIVEDSGWTSGSTVAYGTTKSVGASGWAVVQVRDNVLRDATPGDPDYVQTTQAFTVTPSGTPSVIASVAASSNGVSPVVTLTGTRAAGIPDEVAVYRNSKLVGRVPGASVFSGTAMTYIDKTAPPNTSAAYEVFAIVGGAWSSISSPPANITPRCTGIWILDPASTAAAMLLGDDDQDQSEPEISVVHRPLSGPEGLAQVVRRRLTRYPREGVVSGLLADALGITAAASEAALLAWELNDAGYLYRLVMGNRNDQVILGDIELDELSDNGATNGRLVGVSANWWAQS